MTLLRSRFMKKSSAAPSASQDSQAPATPPNVCGWAHLKQELASGNIWRRIVRRGFIRIAMVSGP